MLISILTPSLNSGRYLGDAVRSVQMQGVAFEHIVQDGLSSDETTRLLAREFTHVHWRSEADSGQSDALNRALERATGDWIGWLNADEFYFPYALRRLLGSPKTRNADVVYGDTVFVDVCGRFLRLVATHRPSGLVTRFYGIPLDTSSMLVRRSVLRDIGFSTQLKVIMDWNLLLELDRAGASLAHIQTPVGAFRVHDDQVTALDNVGVRRRWRVPALSAADHDEEFYHVQGQFSLRRGGGVRLLGRTAHVALKAANGAYRREWRAQQLSGADLRWFDHRRGMLNVRQLMHAYGDA